MREERHRAPANRTLFHVDGVAFLVVLHLVRPSGCLALLLERCGRRKVRATRERPGPTMDRTQKRLHGILLGIHERVIVHQLLHRRSVSHSLCLGHLLGVIAVDTAHVRLERVVGILFLSGGWWLVCVEASRQEALG